MPAPRGHFRFRGPSFEERHRLPIWRRLQSPQSMTAWLPGETIALFARAVFQYCLGVIERLTTRPYYT